MRYELKSVGIWSYVKVAFFLNLIAGFLFGLLYAVGISFFMAVLSEFPAIQGSIAPFDGGSAIGLMIFLPLVGAFGMAFFGTISFTIMTLLYNLIARVLGGVELVLDPIREEVKPKPPLTAVRDAGEPPVVAPVPPPPVYRAPSPAPPQPTQEATPPLPNRDDTGDDATPQPPTQTEN